MCLCVFKSNTTALSLRATHNQMLRSTPVRHMHMLGISNYVGLRSAIVGGQNQITLPVRIMSQCLHMI